MERHTPIKSAKPDLVKQRRNGATARKRTATQPQRNGAPLAVQPTSPEPSTSQSLIDLVQTPFQQMVVEHAAYRVDHPEIETSRNGAKSVDDFLVRLGEQYAYDPYGFYQELFPQRPLRDWQANTLKTVRDALEDNPTRLRLAIASGKGAGKTDVLSILNVWHVACHQDSETLLLANTGRQVDEVPWDRIRHLVYNSSLDKYFRVLSNKIVHRQIDTWSGITLRAQHDRVESVHGFHANFLAVFVDEASGVHDRILDSLESGLTDEHGYMFLFSNPTKIQGYFRRCFPGGAQASKWITSNIDTRTILEVNQNHIQEQFEKYGCNDDHPYFRMFVRGIFPLTDKHQFFTEELLDLAMNRDGISLDNHPYVIGIDPSLGGPSKTAIVVRHGGKILARESFFAKYEESASRCYELCSRYQQYKPYIIIEGGAVGEGFIVAFKPYHLDFIPFIPSETADRVDIYANKRAEMYGNLRDALQGELQLVDEEIRGQLLELTYIVNTRHQFLLESKDDMASRGFASPDESDALAFTYYKNFEPIVKRHSLTPIPPLLTSHQYWMV